MQSNAKDKRKYKMKKSLPEVKHLHIPRKVRVRKEDGGEKRVWVTLVYEKCAYMHRHWYMYVIVYRIHPWYKAIGKFVAMQSLD